MKGGVSASIMFNKRCCNVRNHIIFITGLINLFGSLTEVVISDLHWCNTITIKFTFHTEQMQIVYFKCIIVAVPILMYTNSNTIEQWILFVTLLILNYSSVPVH